MKVHFICTGNVYRSRLAEAWCVSRRVPGIEVSSSGIAAGRESPEPISPWAAEALARRGLDAFAAKHWQRTTRSLVESSDVIVCMESEHHGFCREWVDPSRQRIEVWGIEDIGPMAAEEIPDKVERTFGLIRARVDGLLESLRQGGTRQAVPQCGGEKAAE
ncbi:MAG TPA: low molecular weight phosphatase family protein [Acidobacteriaceae bacterium]|jgi:protein-tyrosine-phosphatase|nr:low molecular weight phosphatase family protein [Acidobacteriaceae bacterium]